jgi:hypothetical protein
MLTIVLPFLLKLLLFLAVLSLLVFFHEFGHFFAAKLCGIYVKRFSLGMPPRVFGVKIGETDYCISAIPFGVPLSEEEREKEFGGVPEHRWFANKPVWQRLIVLVMGPLMNLVLAVLLYGMIAVIGSEVPESDVMARVGEVVKDSPAATAPMFRMDDNAVPAVTGTSDATGWQLGDLIVSVDGHPPWPPCCTAPAPCMTWSSSATPGRVRPSGSLAGWRPKLLTKANIRVLAWPPSTPWLLATWLPVRPPPRRVSRRVISCVAPMARQSP